MVLRPLSKRDKEIKAAVLRGESVTVIARNKKMSRAAVYRVIDELGLGSMWEESVLSGNNHDVLVTHRCTRCVRVNCNLLRNISG